MRISLSVLMLVFIVVLGACKSEYEKIRQSNDPAAILKKGNEYYDGEDYIKAQTLYELAISAYRGQEESEELFFRYAYCHYFQKQYILANHYFQNFSNTFINSSKREEAAFMSAYSSYKQSPIYRLDQDYSRKAIEGLQTFVNTYPNSTRVEQCNSIIDELRSKLEQKLFEEAKLYFDLREYQASNRSFENLLKEFPETQNHEEIRYMMVESSYRWAENSIYEKRKERYQETLNLGELFLKKYAKSSWRKDVRSLISASKNSIKKLVYD